MPLSSPSTEITVSRSGSQPQSPEEDGVMEGDATALKSEIQWYWG
jgi:hypothetical protein